MSLCPNRIKHNKLSMATAGTTFPAVGVRPSFHRRKTCVKLISKSRLSVFASAVPTEKQPQRRAAAAVGGVGKKPAAEWEAEPEDGSLSLKDYFEQSREIISRSDGGPPRWFSPLECGSRLKDSPVLLYLPGAVGVGLGLILHHERLGKIFDIWCLHIPLTDRTSFPELVKFVEKTARIEYSRAPNRPVYLVGESFGACLALAVAARNPDINLMLILANPATSFGTSMLQPPKLPPLSPLIPDQLTSSFPYALTLLLGNLGFPVKMVTSAIRKRLPSEKVIEDTIAMSSYLFVLSKFFTGETLRWKLGMIKSAAAYANSRLHAVKAPMLILASGQDQLLPSSEEAERLRKLLPNCQTRAFEDSGHALFLEDDLSLVSTLIGASFYRRRGRLDYVLDYIHPTPSEFRKVYEAVKGVEDATNPVMLSTLENGKIVRGLGGIPSEGPVLYVGYHMMLGLDLFPLVTKFWIERKILLRGMAHPMMFTKLKEGILPDLSFFDIFRVMGAVPVSAPNFYRLFSLKSHILLYPGGIREAFHRKGEEYKLFWPDQSEFIRMAARFGAKIIPFGTVGEDDLTHLLLDYDDQRNIPYFKNVIEEVAEETLKLRTDAMGEIGNQDIHLPIVVPKVPGRFYYLFGKPIETEGRKQELKSKEKADELYLEVKSEVEKCLSYLKEKRENDPYRNIFARLSYQATHGFDSEIPTFDFTTRNPN